MELKVNKLIEQADGDVILRWCEVCHSYTDGFLAYTRYERDTEAILVECKA